MSARPFPRVPGYTTERGVSYAPAAWTEHVFSTAATLTATPLNYRHGLIEVGPGVGSSTTFTDRRSVWTPPQEEAVNSHVRSIWWGDIATGSTDVRPQHGHAHRLVEDSDGVRAVVVWHDILFGQPQILNLAQWSAAADGTGFAVTNGTLVDYAAVTAGSRTSNVVTVTVPAGHPFRVGDVITANLTDNTYDGTFTVTATTATTITWAQTAANDASAGTGTVVLFGINNGTLANLLRSVSSTDAVRAGGAVTATVPAGHPFVPGDVINATYADTTYTGRWFVTATTATTVTWLQTAADDPSAGAGTVVKAMPYIVDSWLVGDVLTVAAQPYSGPTALVPIPAPPAPTDPTWSVSLRLSSAGTGLAALPDEPGRCGVLGAHLSTLSRCRYSGLTIDSLDS